MKKMMMSAGVMLMLVSCKRYTCECSTITLQSRSEDAYQVSAYDKSEALSKCTQKHNRSTIGGKTSCMIK